MLSGRKGVLTEVFDPHHRLERDSKTGWALTQFDLTSNQGTPKERANLMRKLAKGYELMTDIWESIYKQRGGDTRHVAIQQMWSDEETLKRFARLVDELKPVWTTIKSMADPCNSKEAQDDWLSSVMSDRPVIRDFMTRYSKLTPDVLRRAVDNRLKRIDKETRVLAYFHAALELEVQINGDTLSIIDAYVMYQGKPSAPISLETFYDRGKALLNPTE